MRILQIHNYYQLAGGEDTVVASERELLVAHGHEVRLFSASNNEIRSVAKKLVAGLNVIYSRQAASSVSAAIEAFRPDVVHVHNFFPLLTPSVFDSCRRHGVPVVLTLHNFRLFCPGGLLMRDGMSCEDCLPASPYRSLCHRCYRNSFLGTLAVALMIDYHRHRRTWLEKVDCFIALTNFCKRKFVEAGIPESKLCVKPNSVSGSLYLQKPQGNGALFVGRLTAEKGVGTLLAAWRGVDFPLAIVGEGPLAPTAPPKGITFLGRLFHEEVAAEMANAQFLVMPSQCYEAFGLVIIEAFAQGTPVIASRMGSMAEIIEDGVTGLLFEPGNVEDLRTKVLWAVAHPEKMRSMGKAAHAAYLEKFTSEVNYSKLMEIYCRLLRS